MILNAHKNPHSLDIAVEALDRIYKLIENTGEWNAELGLQQIRVIVMQAQTMMYHG